jgi:hypothetical protein
MAFYKIIASQIGADAGPFIIRSNTGAILATGVTRQQLLDGYSFDVPTGVTSVNIQNAPSNTNCSGTTTFTIPSEGRWEMEKSNVETISDHYGVLFNAYTTPVESFVAQDIIGIYAGVVSEGTGIWTIKGTSEDIAGTTYGPGGTLILTGVNTNSQTTVQGGAKLQLGLDTDSYTGQVGANLTINTGGIVNVVGANETERRAFGILVNNGQMNITGPDRCGEGYFRNGGNITQNNGATITIDKAYFRLANPMSFASTGGGFIDVKDGSTLETFGVDIPANHTLKLAGCGKCNDIGTQDGALLVSTPSNIGATLDLQSNVCLDHVGTGLATISGRINGNYKITLNNQADSTTRAGVWSFTNNTTPYFDNTIEVKNTTLYSLGVNSLSKADVVLLGTGYIQQDAGTVNLGSLSGESTTGIMGNSSFTLVLKENGSTTYAGSIANSTPGTPWTFTIVGPDTNVIKLTNPTGNTAVNLVSSLGGRIIVEAGRYNQWSGVGTISAGKTIATANNAHLTNLTISSTGALDVYASGSTTGMLLTGNASLGAGWKVNLMEPLPAGTHRILQKQNTVLTLPTLGTNLSGKTVTGFANDGVYITVTLV